MATGDIQGWSIDPKTDLVHVHKVLTITQLPKDQAANAMKRRRTPPELELPAEARADMAKFAAFEAQCAALFDHIDEANGQPPPPKSAEIIPFKPRRK